MWTKLSYYKIIYSLIISILTNILDSQDISTFGSLLSPSQIEKLSLPLLGLGKFKTEREQRFFQDYETKKQDNPFVVIHNTERMLVK